MNENLATDRAQKIFDPQIRAAIRADPRQYAIDNGMIKADASVEIKLVVCGRKQILIPMVRPSVQLSLKQLGEIQAAGNYGMASVGTFGTSMSAATFGRS